MSECNFFPFFTSFPLSLSVVCCASKGGKVMKEVSGFNITDKEFKLLSKKAKAVYNITIVADYFCTTTQEEIEELYNLTPISKNLRAEAELKGLFLTLKGSSYAL